MTLQLQTVTNTLKKQKADAILLIAKINRTWFCNCNTEFGIIVINQKQQVRIFVDHRDYEQIKKTVKGYHIELFERYSQFASWIKTQHFQTVLIEADTLTVSQFDRLIKPLKFPHVINFNSDQLRIVKTPAEIKAIKKACDIAVAGVAYLRKIAKVGVTERYLKDSLIKFFLNKYNVVPSFDPIILSGPNTALPHGVSGNRKIKRGEFILVDIGCIYHNYCSDISRTFWIGTLPASLQKLYNTVLIAQQRGLKSVVCAAKASNVDTACRDYIDSFPQYKNQFNHATGHGVGINIHELPTVGPKSEYVLVNNEVLTVEPGIYLNGIGGVRIEDTVIVNNNKCINLTVKAKK